MNLTQAFRRPEVCQSCRQPIVPPTSSTVLAVRLAMTAGALLAGAVEYRRAVKREREQAHLEQTVAADIDAPLDAHLATRDAEHDSAAVADHPYSTNPPTSDGDDADGT